MKRILSISLMAALALGFSACSSSEKKSDKAAATACAYTLSDDVTFQFVSYKTSAKAPVAGTFDKMEMLVPNNGAASLTEALKGASLKINTASVNSKDAIRDTNIRTYFFGTMKNGASLDGKIQSASGDETSGELSVFLSMNGLGENLGMSYTVDENTVYLTGKLDLGTWNALSSLASLNEKCFELHKGADGDSKLWDEVEINISFNLSAEGC